MGTGEDEPVVGKSKAKDLGESQDRPLHPGVEVEVTRKVPSALTAAIYTLIDEVRELRASVNDVSHKVDASILSREMVQREASGSKSSTHPRASGWGAIVNCLGGSQSEPTQSLAPVLSPADISPITLGSTRIPSEDLERLRIGTENPPSSIAHRPNTLSTDERRDTVFPVVSNIPPDQLAPVLHFAHTPADSPSSAEQPNADPDHLVDPGVQLESSAEQTTGSNNTDDGLPANSIATNDSGSLTGMMDLSG
jgi:hypothetical protein